ncbi:branched-chain amino acid transaminase [Oligoflexia bacterium]|nr:branched-chain amino acid transaminase [Oligoflexia bacterium]
MEATEKIWKNGEFMPWEECTTHVLTHSLHYGTSAWEGIRIYETEQGSAIFRLQEHIDRLFRSCETMAIELPFTAEAVRDAIHALVCVNNLKQGYIRPIAYYGFGGMGLKPDGAEVDFVIACWLWGRYLPYDMVDLKVSNYVRIDSSCMAPNVKIGGNYVNSILAALQIRGTKYHEALLLDREGNIAEGPGENFFIVKDKIIKTPALGCILPGITRDTIIQIAKHLGYELHETEINLAEACAADEAFYTGTAAEVTPIRSIDDHVVGDGQVGAVTTHIKSTYLDIVYGRDQNFSQFTDYVDLTKERR